MTLHKKRSFPLRTSSVNVTKYGGKHFLPPDTHTYVCVSGRKKCLPVDLVTLTEEILNGKLDFLCSGKVIKKSERREKIKLNFYFHTSLWCLNSHYFFVRPS